MFVLVSNKVTARHGFCWGRVFWVGLLLGLGCSGAMPAASAVPTVAPEARVRVVIVEDERATDIFKPQAAVIREMVERGLTRLTGEASLAAAWHCLVSTQDVVGLKVHSAPGALLGTRPAVVEALVAGLLTAGIPPQQIVIWDRHLADLQRAGFAELARRYQVRLAGAQDTGFDPEVFYDTPLVGSLIWGDYEFGRTGEGVGRKSFVSRLLTKELTKIVLVTPLLNHNYTGVAGNLYSLAAGSVDNFLRFETSADRLAVAVPEIVALPVLSDHVVLGVVDALLCQYEGGNRGRLHYSTALNQLWFSRDLVALDVCALTELERQRQHWGVGETRHNRELYENAALLELGVADPEKIHKEHLR